MTMHRLKIILLVEGHGDIIAVPRLLHNIMKCLKIYDVDTDRRPMKVGEIAKLQSDGVLEKFIRYACMKDGDLILLIVDCDDDCPVDVARDFLNRIKSMGGAVSKKIGVVFFKKEFESLFLFSIEALAAATPEFGWDLEDFDVDRDMEEIRDAKGQLRRLMKGGKTYKETTDQTQFIKALNFDRLRERSRSFQHFQNTIKWAAGLHQSDAQFYPVLE